MPTGDNKCTACRGKFAEKGGLCVDCLRRGPVAHGKVSGLRQQQSQMLLDLDGVDTQTGLVDPRILDDPRLTPNGQRLALAMAPDPTEWRYTGRFYHGSSEYDDHCTCGVNIAWQFPIRRERDGAELTIGSVCIVEAIPVLTSWNPELADELERAVAEQQEFVLEEQRRARQATAEEKLAAARVDATAFNEWAEANSLREHLQPSRELSSPGRTYRSLANKYTDAFRNALLRDGVDVPPLPQCAQLREETVAAAAAAARSVERDVRRYEQYLERAVAEHPGWTGRDGYRDHLVADGMNALDAEIRANDAAEVIEPAEESLRAARAKHHRALEVEAALVAGGDGHWSAIPRPRQTGYRNNTVLEPTHPAYTSTDPAELRRIIAGPDMSAGAAVLARSDLPAEVVDDIRRSSHERLRQRYVAAPSRSTAELAPFADDPSVLVGRSLARRGDLPEEMIGRLAAHPESMVRQEALRNPRVPVGSLERAAEGCTTGEAQAILSMSSRLSADSSAWRALAANGDPQVRRWVVADRHAPADVKRTLVDDTDPVVARRAAEWVSWSDRQATTPAAPAPSARPRARQSRPRGPRGGKLMESRYGGRCVDCGGRIPRGGMMEFDGKVHHPEVCSPTV